MPEDFLPGAPPIGSYSTATRVSCGSASFSSSSRFEAISGNVTVSPVTLPPGRARLCAQPSLTGSLPDTATIRMLRVASVTAATGAGPEVAMTSTPA